MIYDTVIAEIDSVRSENNLPEMRITGSTLLEDLGFDSLMYAVLMGRLERKLSLTAWDGPDDAVALPVVVGDVVRMYEPPPRAVGRSNAA